MLAALEKDSSSFKARALLPPPGCLGWVLLGWADGLAPTTCCPARVASHPAHTLGCPSLCSPPPPPPPPPHARAQGKVVVIRYEGPKGGPGMPEMLTPTSAIMGAGLGKECALITDGRFRWAELAGWSACSSVGG